MDSDAVYRACRDISAEQYAKSYQAASRSSSAKMGPKFHAQHVRVQGFEVAERDGEAVTERWVMRSFVGSDSMQHLACWSNMRWWNFNAW